MKFDKYTFFDSHILVQNTLFLLTCICHTFFFLFFLFFFFVPIGKI